MKVEVNKNESVGPWVKGTHGDYMYVYLLRYDEGRCAISVGDGYLSTRCEDVPRKLIKAVNRMRDQLKERP